MEEMGEVLESGRKDIFKVSIQEKPVELTGDVNVDAGAVTKENFDPLGLIKPIEGSSLSLAVLEKSEEVVAEVEEKRDLEIPKEELTEIKEEKPRESISQEKIEEPQSVIKTLSIESENVEVEKGSERELVERWVNHFLTWNILDEYALNYVKNKKSNEEKRKNKKYGKNFRTAEKNFKKTLSRALTTSIEDGKLNNNSSAEDVKKAIEKILRSDMRATKLADIIKNSQFQEIKEVVIEDEKPLIVNNKQDEDEKEKISTEEGIEATTEEIVEQNEIVGSTPEKETGLEAPKTEEEFFDKYSKEEGFTDPFSGKEYKILSYDSEKKEVILLVYQVSNYDYENEAHDFGAKEVDRLSEETLSYSDFVELFEKSYSHNETEIATEEATKDMIVRKNEKIDITGLVFVNEKGEYFRVKEYFKKQTKKGGEIRRHVKIEVDEKIKEKKEREMDTNNFHEFVEKGKFESYENESALIEAFEEEFGENKQTGNLMIISFGYVSEEGKYLAKIKEADKEPRLVNIKELRALVGNIEENKMDDPENEIEKLEKEFATQDEAQKTEQEITTVEDFWKNFGHLVKDGPEKLFDELNCDYDEEKKLLISFKIGNYRHKCDIKDFEKSIKQLVDFKNDFIEKYDKKNGLKINSPIFSEGKGLTNVDFHIGEEDYFQNLDSFLEMINKLNIFWEEFEKYKNQDDLKILYPLFNFYGDLERVAIRRGEEATQVVKLEEFSAIIEDSFEKLDEIESKVFGIYDEELKNIEKSAEESWNKLEWLKTSTLKDMIENYMDDYRKNKLLERIREQLKGKILEESMNKIFRKIIRQAILKKIK